MEDIIFILFKGIVDLPTFVVEDLSLLPPLGVKNVDCAFLLGEMRAMRAEIASLREAVDARQPARQAESDWLTPAESSPQLTQRDMQPLTVHLPSTVNDKCRTSATTVTTDKERGPTTSEQRCPSRLDSDVTSASVVVRG